MKCLLTCYSWIGLELFPQTHNNHQGGDGSNRSKTKPHKPLNWENIDNYVRAYRMNIDD